MIFPPPKLRECNFSEFFAPKIGMSACRGSKPPDLPLPAAAAVAKAPRDDPPEVEDGPIEFDAGGVPAAPTAPALLAPGDQLCTSWQVVRR